MMRLSIRRSAARAAAEPLATPRSRSLKAQRQPAFSAAAQSSRPHMPQCFWPRRFRATPISTTAPLLRMLPPSRQEDRRVVPLSQALGRPGKRLLFLPCDHRRQDKVPPSSLRRRPGRRAERECRVKQRLFLAFSRRIIHFLRLLYRFCFITPHNRKNVKLRCAPFRIAPGR